MDTELIRRIDELQHLYDDLVKPEIPTTAEMQALLTEGPVWLTTPYTHTDFNGDSFSDVAAATKIENTGWSTTIPATAKALLVQIVAQDSGSAATAGLYFSLYPTSAGATSPLSCRPSGKANDDWADELGIVSCTNGDLWYKCNASGASTLNVWLRIWAYWL